MEVVLRISFFFSNADFWFDVGDLTWRLYTAIEALLITSKVELIDKRKLAKTVFDKNSEIFVVYVTAMEASALIYSSETTQIVAL